MFLIVYVVHFGRAERYSYISSKLNSIYVGIADSHCHLTDFKEVKCKETDSIHSKWLRFYNFINKGITVRDIILFIHYESYNMFDFMLKRVNQSIECSNIIWVSDTVQFYNLGIHNIGCETIEDIESCICKSLGIVKEIGIKNLIEQCSERKSRLKAIQTSEISVKIERKCNFGKKLTDIANRLGIILDIQENGDVKAYTIGHAYKFNMYDRPLILEKKSISGAGYNKFELQLNNYSIFDVLTAIFRHEENTYLSRLNMISREYV